MVSFVFAQELEIEETKDEEPESEYIEEEYVEEEILIEDKAGTTPDSPFYFVDKVVEDINLAVKKGEDKADYALEVSEEKVAEAKLMADYNKSIETERALTRANNVSRIIEEEVSPNLRNKTTEKMEFIDGILEDMEGQIPEDWTAIQGLIDNQQTQTEKNRIAAELAVKIADLCEKLAMQDYSLMEAEPRCDPDNAPDWLRELIKDEINKREEEAKRMLVEQITTCINDPRDCDCSQIPVESNQLECEKNTALAIECEYEQNMKACEELDKTEMPKIEHMPPFLQDVFEKTFTELIEKKRTEAMKKFAPKECIEANAFTREECEAIMEEKYGPPPEECLKDGVFIGEEECNAIMIEKYNIPDECIEDGKPIPKEECMEKMLPEPCKEANAFTEEECKAIMEKSMGEGMPGEMPREIPEDCVRDGEFIGQEECEEVMREKFEKQSREGAGECMRDGEFIGEEECEKIMREKFESGEVEKKEEVKISIPEYPEKKEEILVINEEGAEKISAQDLEEIKNKAKERAEEEIVIPDEVKDLSKEIADLEKEKEGIETGEIEEKSEEPETIVEEPQTEIEETTEQEESSI